MTWLGLIPLTLAVCVLAGAIWQAWSERRDRRRFPAPGSFVEKLHVNCSGAGTPVLLEAGVAASSVGWTLVQRQLRPDCKVCATDRPGFGWSLPSEQARTPEQFVREMDLVLRHIGVPAILVGHSFGGLLVQLYAAGHPENVLGVVLVDPPHLSEWCDPAPSHRARLQRGARLARRGAWIVRTGFVRLALVLLTRGSPKASKAFAAASSGRAARGYLEGLVGQVSKLPRELWPLLQAHWCRASGFASIADHLESLPRGCGGSPADSAPSGSACDRHFGRAPFAGTDCGTCADCRSLPAGAAPGSRGLGTLGSRGCSCCGGGSGPSDARARRDHSSRLRNRRTTKAAGS